MITNINNFRSILESKREITETELMYFNYLNDLRESDVTNMYGASSYLQEEFDLNRNKASEILVLWMKNFRNDNNYQKIEESFQDLTSEEQEVMAYLNDLSDNISDMDQSVEYIDNKFSFGVNKSKEMLTLWKTMYESSKITEAQNANTSMLSDDNTTNTEIPEALSDINDMRPTRMKRPSKNTVNPFGVYIQDEAERIAQDKYGKIRGTKIWDGSIGQGVRGGAMFQMADDIMKEKTFLIKKLNLTLNTANYWEYSYFYLWKLWMDSIDKTYNMPSSIISEPENIITTEPQVDTNNDIDTVNNVDNLPFTSVTQKDIDRIENIDRRSNGSASRRARLASQMANSITNAIKAVARGKAAINHGYNDIANIFFNRAHEILSTTNESKFNKTNMITSLIEFKINEQHDFDEDTYNAIHQLLYGLEDGSLTSEQISKVEDFF